LLPFLSVLHVWHEQRKISSEVEHQDPDLRVDLNPVLSELFDYARPAPDIAAIRSSSRRRVLVRRERA
jgi:hypothetical protein